MSIEPEFEETSNTEGETGTEKTADELASGEPADAELDELEEAQRRMAGLKEQLMRTAADFDNFRKRSRREIEDALHSGRESMLKELLPVFDNLERATALADSATDVASFVSGIEMVMRQFADSLKRSGIERVSGVGAPFDPTVHEAIQQQETAEFPAGTVVAEVQGGYRMGERLIRPAMVVVAKSPASSQAPTRPPPGADDDDSADGAEGAPN